MNEAYEKHYDSSYLDSTGDFLRLLKQSSYLPFKDFQHILDIGCGVGTDVLEMKKMYPDKTIMGIDHDPRLIEIAQNSSKEWNLQDVSFHKGNAESLEMFEAECLDGVRFERVYQHLQDPELVTKEVNRILKPGGKIVVLETDWLGITVFNRFSETLQKLQLYLTEQKVVNGYASRQLYHHLKLHGFENIRQKVLGFNLESLAQANKLVKLDQMIEEMTQNSILTHKEQTEWNEENLKLDNSDSFNVYISMILITANRG